jgi:hypothetical protein
MHPGCFAGIALVIWRNFCNSDEKIPGMGRRDSYKIFQKKINR